VHEFTQFTTSLRNMVYEHLGEVADRHSGIEREIADLGSGVAEVQDALDQTRDRIAEITALQDIDTPFGPLPIGVNDLVMLFPVVLAAGFYLTMLLAAQVLELRQWYFRVVRRGAPDFFTRRYVAMIAPVWVDPLRPFTERLRHCALLALPALLFVASIGLLIVNGLLWGDFMDEVRLARWSYYAAYAVGALLFAASARRLAGQYRSAVDDADTASLR